MSSPPPTFRRSTQIHPSIISAVSSQKLLVRVSRAVTSGHMDVPYFYTIVEQHKYRVSDVIYPEDLPRMIRIFLCLDPPEEDLYHPLQFTVWSSKEVTSATSQEIIWSKKLSNTISHFDQVIRYHEGPGALESHIDAYISCPMVTLKFTKAKERWVQEAQLIMAEKFPPNLKRAPWLSDQRDGSLPREHVVWSDRFKPPPQSGSRSDEAIPMNSGCFSSYLPYSPRLWGNNGFYGVAHSLEYHRSDVSVYMKNYHQRPLPGTPQKFGIRAYLHPAKELKRKRNLHKI